MKVIVIRCQSNQINSTPVSNGNGVIRLIEYLDGLDIAGDITAICLLSQTRNQMLDNISTLHQGLQLLGPKMHG